MPSGQAKAGLCDIVCTGDSLASLMEIAYSLQRQISECRLGTFCNAEKAFVYKC